MNEFTCPICGKTVSKRQSISGVFNGVAGRACKDHTEAQRAKFDAERAERDKKLQEKMDKEKKQERIDEQNRFLTDKTYRDQKTAETTKFFHEHCHKCGVQGYKMQQEAYRALIAQQKMKLKDGKTTFKNEMALPGKRVAIFDYKGGRLFSYEIYQFCSLLGKVQLCEDCAKSMGISQKQFLDTYAPPITEKQLEAGMIISSLIEPELKKQAEIECLVDTLKN